MVNQDYIKTFHKETEDNDHALNEEETYGMGYNNSTS